METERDTTGKFTKGNPGGPGRPRRQTEERFMAAFAEIVTEEDWQAIIEAAKTAALEGDATARNWLAKYLIGSLVRLPEVKAEPIVPPELEAEIDRLLHDEIDLEPELPPEANTKWFDQIKDHNPAMAERYLELKRQKGKL